MLEDAGPQKTGMMAVAWLLHRLPLQLPRDFILLYELVTGATSCTHGAQPSKCEGGLALEIMLVVVRGRAYVCAFLCPHLRLCLCGRLGQPCRARLAGLALPTPAGRMTPTRRSP